jgi:hypothetical protein
MRCKDKILRETSPLSIFFVKSGSGGNRLLFRYPYDSNFQFEPELALHGNQFSEKELLRYQSVINEGDEALCNMFSVNPSLCGQKFEIKISSVRHIGHPMSLLSGAIGQIGDNNYGFRSDQYQSRVQARSTHDPISHDCSEAPKRKNKNTSQGDITSFNIVCALRASASYDIVDCYHDLSKRLAIGLGFEERRDSYLSKEIKIILAALEENDMAKLRAENENQDHQSVDQGSGLDSAGNPISTNGDNQGVANPGEIFRLILERSNLARDLKRVFMSLSTSGIIDLKINNFVRVSFCLPQKVHRLKLMTHKSMPAIGNQDIKHCLLALRPYHGLLLLQEQQELLNSLPIDASPAFIQLIQVTKPDKNFMELSVDANLTLMQIFHIVSQLIYWAKATVIYPICDSNIYAIHPLASTGLSSKLVNDFKVRFPSNKSLHHYLADFSEGISLSQLNGPLLSLDEKLNLLSIVTWLLQRRILTQMHKYIFLVVDKEKAYDARDKPTMRQQSGFSDNLSPGGIEINMSNSNHPFRLNNGLRLATNPSNSFDMSPRMVKNSFSESIDSSIRRFRADSLPESQDDSNFGLNSSLSSTPNSNLEYPSPSNGDLGAGLSFSNSFPFDSPIGIVANESAISALQRAGLTQAGAKHVLSIPSSKSVDDLKLLIRLMPYFNGKHHIEDIMFLENLERSQVLILCDKFRDILFTCHYEDVAVSQLCPFTSGR